MADGRKPGRSVRDAIASRVFVSRRARPFGTRRHPSRGRAAGGNHGGAVNHAAARLASSGMSPAEAARKAGLFAAAERALKTPIRRRWFVPGRIEVLGK